MNNDTAMYTSDMLPCPFCGGKAEMLAFLDDAIPPRIECSRCYVLMTGTTDEAVIARWNRRSSVSVNPLAARRIFMAIHECPEESLEHLAKEIEVFVDRQKRVTAKIENEQDA